MKIIKYKVKKDGSAIMDYSLTEKEEKFLKIVAEGRGVKYSKKFANEIILEALKKKINGEIK